MSYSFEDAVRDFLEGAILAVDVYAAMSDDKSSEDGENQKTDY